MLDALFLTNCCGTCSHCLEVAPQAGAQKPHQLYEGVRRLRMPSTLERFRAKQARGGRTARLFSRVGPAVTRVMQHDVVRAGCLSLKRIRRIDQRARWMSDRAQQRAAACLGHLGELHPQSLGDGHGRILTESAAAAWNRPASGRRTLLGVGPSEDRARHLFDPGQSSARRSA